MEATSRVLDPVVIAQDEGSELHVQPVIQSGRRQIDIRLWRRGPGGFAPSRNALTVEAPDLTALYDGISELLMASSEGRQVARVVWDRDEGRRLRAETVPFGTRFMTRLGFWQRVRDTWRPADDGLVIAADLLRPLLDVLRAMREQFLEAAEGDLLRPDVSFDAEHERRWPSPGADWITIDPDRIAFHPRGVRITATVDDAEGPQRLLLRLWQRVESIWLPDGDDLALSLQDVDGLLRALRGDPIDEIPIVRTDATSVRLRIDSDESSSTLLIEEEVGDAYVRRIAIPADYLPRLGRLLAQCGALLLMHISPQEREALLHRPDGPVVSAEIVEDALVIAEPEVPPMEEHPAPPSEAEAEMQPRPTSIEPTPSEPQRHVAPLGQVRLGHQEVALLGYLLDDEPLYVALRWDDGSLAIRIDHTPQMIDNLRSLYYDALRGHRGQVYTVPGSPATHMSIHSHGAGIDVTLDQESADRVVSLRFPVSEVPTFLNAADAAMQRIHQHDL